jgi:hypothetical protein
LLTLWQFGIVSDAEVEAWLNDELVRVDTPSEALLDLVCHGPATCLGWAEHVFPIRPLVLGYQDEFALRSLALDLDSEEELGRFVSWASWESAYEDRQDCYAAFGYELAALCFEECGVESGSLHVQRHLPAFRPQLQATAQVLVDMVPGLAPSRLRH